MVNSKWLNSKLLDSKWLVLAALLAGACKPSATLDETSPKFYFPSDSVYTAYRDTLRLSGDLQDGFQLDSITAGDTATLHLEVDGVFHPLAAIGIRLSEPDVAELLYPAGAQADSLFDVAADSTGYWLTLRQQRTRIPITFQYHARQASRDIGVTITATSEASEAYRLARLTLHMPIRRTPAPAFFLPSDTLYTEQGDTLLIRQSSGYRLDALQPGDAVQLVIGVHGVYNRLKQLRITPANTADAVLTYPDAAELDEVFLPTSDYANGVFDMDSSFVALQLPFRLQALQPNEDFILRFEATSDAPADSNTSTFELHTPIAARDTVAG